MLVVEAMNEKKNDNERQGVSSGNECAGSVKKYNGPFRTPRIIRAGLDEHRTLFRARSFLVR
jgi:hypothetical protein